VPVPLRGLKRLPRRAQGAHRRPGALRRLRAGLTEALADPDQRALVTAALSPLQQRALRLAEEDLG